MYNSAYSTQNKKAKERGKNTCVETLSERLQRFTLLCTVSAFAHVKCEAPPEFLCDARHGTRIDESWHAQKSQGTHALMKYVKYRRDLCMIYMSRYMRG